MSQLRLSSHRLFIETGRWNQPTCTPINERICICCQSLDNEYNFIIEFKSYIELRKQLISIYDWKHPNMLKFTGLVNCINAPYYKKSGSYVNKAFKLRNDI